MSTAAFERVSRVVSRPDDPASIAVSLGATELDISLVDNEVRRVLAALHGNKKETYAGRSNESPLGVAYLKKQLERLMKEKAEFKEKKLALLQLQQQLGPEQPKYPQPAPAAAGDGGGGAAAARPSSAPAAPSATADGEWTRHMCISPLWDLGPFSLPTLSSTSRCFQSAFLGFARDDEWCTYLFFCGHTCGGESVRPFL